jgi:Fe-S cluster assembly iron-binding protein IscA
MSKWAIFSKDINENNFYRLAYTDEIKNHYFNTNVYTPIVLTDQQYGDILKKNKKAEYNHSTNTLNLTDIDYEQEILNNGLTVSYLDVEGATAEKEGIIATIDRYLKHYDSSAPGQTWIDSKKTMLNNLNVTTIDYTQNFKNFVTALESTGEEAFDVTLIP